MAGEIRHPFLKSLGTQIRVLEVEYGPDWIEFLRKSTVPICEAIQGRIIDWASVPEKFQLWYESDNEDVITEGLSCSALTRHSEVIMGFNSYEPIVVVPVGLFVSNWYELLQPTHRMGTVVVTLDGSLFVEFTDDHESLMISNFFIASSDEVGEKPLLRRG